MKKLLTIAIMSLTIATYGQRMSFGVSTTVPFGMVGMSISSTKTTVGMYADILYSENNQACHAGVRYDLHKIVNPYFGGGFYKDNECSKIGASVVCGFFIGTKKSIIGFQQGFIVDINNGINIRLNIGLTINL